MWDTIIKVQVNKNHGMFVLANNKVHMKRAHEIKIGEIVNIHGCWQRILSCYPHGGDIEWKIIKVKAGSGIKIDESEVNKVEESEEEKLEKLLKPSSEEFWGIS